MRAIEFKRFSPDEVNGIIDAGLKNCPNGLILAKTFLGVPNLDMSKPDPASERSYGRLYGSASKDLSHQDYYDERIGRRGTASDAVLEFIRFPHPGSSALMRLHIFRNPKSSEITTQFSLCDFVDTEKVKDIGSGRLSVELDSLRPRFGFQADDGNQAMNRIGLHILSGGVSLDVDTDFGLWLATGVLPVYGELLQERGTVKFSLPQDSGVKINLPYSFD